MKTIYKAVIRHKKENACISKCNAKKMQIKEESFFLMLISYSWRRKRNQTTQDASFVDVV